MSREDFIVSLGINVGYCWMMVVCGIFYCCFNRRYVLTRQEHWKLGGSDVGEVLSHKIKRTCLALEALVHTMVHEHPEHSQSSEYLRISH